MRTFARSLAVAALFLSVAVGAGAASAAPPSRVTTVSVSPHLPATFRGAARPAPAVSGSKVDRCRRFGGVGCPTLRPRPTAPTPPPVVDPRPVIPRSVASGKGLVRVVDLALPRVLDVPPSPSPTVPKVPPQDSGWCGTGAGWPFGL